MKAVEIQNLSYTYPDGTKALVDLNLEIAERSRVAILGANGSGKTTLIYHLNGLFLPQQGKVEIFGSPVCKSELPNIRRKVGLLFDNPDNQLFSSTVFNDIAFGPRNLKLDEEQVREKVLQAMGAVNILELKDKPPFNISLGQKKKTAIAGLLAMNPRLLVFDEPFSGLDPCSLKQVTRIMNRLNEEGCTMIISTHDVNLAYSWAEQIVLLNKGRLLSCGDTSLLMDRKLMERANLEVPILAEAFAGTGFSPKNGAEAKKVIQDLLKNSNRKIVV